jgi:hypothetical protein
MAGASHGRASRPEHAAEHAARLARLPGQAMLGRGAPVGGRRLGSGTADGRKSFREAPWAGEAPQTGYNSSPCGDFSR